MSTVSIIVPTRNEAENVPALLRRLDIALTGRDAEVVFVDDGTDELPEVAAIAARHITLPVRVIRRAIPTGRLGGAVVEGIRSADTDTVVVCDGDLQHPPELIPELLDALDTHDVAVASRYRPGGDPGGLSTGLRKIVSRTTGLLTKLIFPRRLRGCTDPMSGFFAIRRDVLDVETFAPRGFKILLEIVARSAPLRLTEIPFVFGHRVAGESHATLGEGMRFLRQLAGLRISSSKALLFMLVGMSGVLPNLGLLWALTHSGLHYLPASILAVQGGVLWNFAGAELFVWQDRKIGRLRHRFGKYLVVGETDLLRIPFLVLLVSGLGMNSLHATLLTLLGAFLLRFTLADKLIYRRRPHVTPVASDAVGLQFVASREEAA